MSRRPRAVLGAFFVLLVLLATASALTHYDRRNSAGLEDANPEVPCSPSGSVPEALLSCRNWITFAPPRPFDPSTGTFATAEQIRAVLMQLHDEGWRGLVTYSLDGTLALVPSIAKEVGFKSVVAGIGWYDDPQLQREMDNLTAVAPFADAFVVGNEGILERRYDRARLSSVMSRVAAQTGRPVTTTEPVGSYLADPALATLGDWVFPSIHPWFADIRSPAEGVAFVRSEHRRLQRIARGRPVVAKEAWWPTASHPAATEEAQTAFFGALSETGLPFVWGEAYDQFSKVAEGPQGPHWGLHRSTGEPKRAVEALSGIYRDAYP